MNLTESCLHLLERRKCNKYVSSFCGIVDDVGTSVSTVFFIAQFEMSHPFDFWTTTMGVSLSYTPIYSWSITLSFSGPVVINSAGRLSKYFLNNSSRHLFLQVETSLRLTSNCGLKLNPSPIVFIKPPEKVTNAALAGFVSAFLVASRPC